MMDMHTHTRALSCVHKHTLGARLMMTDSHTHTHMPTLDGLHKHIYTSWCIPLSHLLECFHYMQLAYLFHQCGTSPLSIDSYGRLYSETSGRGVTVFQFGTCVVIRNGNLFLRRLNHKLDIIWFYLHKYIAI